ncbi:MAG: hypothetical protein RMY63_35580 [Nostoc sp. ChiQUE01b]|nr:hypothetical protein [Nostoc sp. ChiQUE01b]
MTKVCFTEISLCPAVLNLLPPGGEQAGNRQSYKRRLKPLVFLDVIFLVFLEGKVGQPVHNLLQVTTA